FITSPSHHLFSPSFDTISLFLYTSTATTAIYTLSLHDALPICIAKFGKFLELDVSEWEKIIQVNLLGMNYVTRAVLPTMIEQKRDRKSTRLNSSHVSISYAVFCLKKKRYMTSTHK